LDFLPYRLPLPLEGAAIRVVAVVSLGKFMNFTRAEPC
jgi:hypothetical protein